MDASNPATDFFPDEVVKIKLLLLCLAWYLFSTVHGNKNLLIGSKEDEFSITIIKICCPTSNVPDKHTTSVLCIDSLNSVNS